MNELKAKTSKNDTSGASPVYSALIVVTCYQSASTIESCIDGLNSQTRNDFFVAIVDNGDNDSSNLQSLSLPANMVVLTPGENAGFAGGSNFGAMNSPVPNTHDWVITVNPDAVLAPDWFETLMQAASDFPNYSLLSTTLLKADAPEIIEGASDFFSPYGIAKSRYADMNYQDFMELDHPSDVFECFAPCGAVAAYRREDFERVSGFDESFFCYLEDIDIAFRLHFLGKKALHVKAAKAYHVGGGSSPANQETAFTKAYHSQQNQIRLLLKHTPFLVGLFIWPCFILATVWILIRSKGQAQHNIRLKALREIGDILPDVKKQRKVIQSSRKLSNLGFSKSLEWNLAKVMKRN